MPKITHVARAQQRWPTKPVLGADGQPVRVPINRRTRAKAGRPARQVTAKRTVQDRSGDPLPLLKCDAQPCRHADRDIQVGTPYKHITPRSGPYGGRQRNRHEDCPDWAIWEYSSSLAARVAQIQHEHTPYGGWADEDDATTARDEAAAAITELAEEKRASQEAMEEGFGHATSASDELGEVADQLDGWAQEVEGVDFPEWPEPESENCGTCGGSGSVPCEACADDPDRAGTCVDCGGEEEVQCPEDCDNGQVTPEEPTDAQVSDWSDEAQEALTAALDNCPV